jgi:hypothetical protein
MQVLRAECYCPMQREAAALRYSLGESQQGGWPTLNTFTVLPAIVLGLGCSILAVLEGFGVGAFFEPAYRRGPRRRDRGASHVPMPSRAIRGPDGWSSMIAKIGLDLGLGCVNVCRPRRDAFPCDLVEPHWPDADPPVARFRFSPSLAYETQLDDTLCLVRAPEARVGHSAMKTRMRPSELIPPRGTGPHQRQHPIQAV